VIWPFVIVRSSWTRTGRPPLLERQVPVPSVGVPLVTV
jgi:hypothetical protein